MTYAGCTNVAHFPLFLLHVSQGTTYLWEEATVRKLLNRNVIRLKKEQVTLNKGGAGS